MNLLMNYVFSLIFENNIKVRREETSEVKFLFTLSAVSFNDSEDFGLQI